LRPPEPVELASPQGENEYHYEDYLADMGQSESKEEAGPAAEHAPDLQAGLARLQAITVGRGHRARPGRGPPGVDRPRRAPDQAQRKRRRRRAGPAAQPLPAAPHNRQGAKAAETKMKPRGPKAVVADLEFIQVRGWGAHAQWGGEG
jgi:hypothetical protein